MPGLLRGMARTAAVVGTATATRNAVNRRQASRNVSAYNAAMYASNSQSAAVQPSPDDDVISQIERLGALKAQGYLTEQEFTLQKAKLLGM